VSVLQNLLLVVHLIGFAVLFGGVAVQVRSEVRVVSAAMLHGALTQVISGLLLIGVIEGSGDSVNSAKMVVKLAVALAISVLCWVNRRKPSVPPGLFFSIGGLTLLNVVIAVFW
jgi:hypothetical protein